MWGFLGQMLGGLLGIGLGSLFARKKGKQAEAEPWKAPAEPWKPPAPPDLQKPETVEPVAQAANDQKAKAAALLEANHANPTGGLGLLGGAALKKKRLLGVE